MELEGLLNKANKVSYNKIVQLIEKREVPKFCKDDCKRIVNIFKRFEGVNITEELAYQLWCTHSQVSFCSNWENMQGVSDEVIFENLLSLIEHVKVD